MNSEPNLARHVRTLITGMVRELLLDIDYLIGYEKKARTVWEAVDADYTRIKREEDERRGDLIDIERDLQKACDAVLRLDPDHYYEDNHRCARFYRTVVLPQEELR